MTLTHKTSRQFCTAKFVCRGMTIVKSWIYAGLAIWLILFLQTQFTPPTLAQAPAQQSPATNAFTRKFTLRKSGLELERRTQAGAFVDVVGRKSAVLGYEHRGLESWVYPMKILDDFELSFKIEGYPLAFHAADSAVCAGGPTTTPAVSPVVP